MTNSHDLPNPAPPPSPPPGGGARHALVTLVLLALLAAGVYYLLRGFRRAWRAKPSIAPVAEGRRRFARALGGYLHETPHGLPAEEVERIVEIVGDPTVFRVPGKRPEGGDGRTPAVDFLFFPKLKLLRQPEAILACDKPGNWPDGGHVLRKNGTVEFVEVSPEAYAAWAAAFAAGERRAAWRGPRNWPPSPAR